MKKSVAQISKILRGLNSYIQKKYNVTELKIFGSYASNAHNSKSDLDLLVTFSETPGLLKFIELENFLSDKIGIKVDLVMENSLKYRLKDSIISNSIPI